MACLERPVCQVFARRCSPSGKAERRQTGDDLLGFERDGDDLADEAEDVLGIILAVGVVGDLVDVRTSQAVP